MVQHKELYQDTQGCLLLESQYAVSKESQTGHSWSMGTRAQVVLQPNTHRSLDVYFDSLIYARHVYTGAISVAREESLTAGSLS